MMSSSSLLLLYFSCFYIVTHMFECHEIGENLLKSPVSLKNPEMSCSMTFLTFLEIQTHSDTFQCFWHHYRHDFHLHRTHLSLLPSKVLGFFLIHHSLPCSVCGLLTQLHPSAASSFYILFTHSCYLDENGQSGYLTSTEPIYSFDCNYGKWTLELL